MVEEKEEKEEEEEEMKIEEKKIKSGLSRSVIHRVLKLEIDLKE